MVVRATSDHRDDAERQSPLGISVRQFRATTVRQRRIALCPVLIVTMTLAACGSASKAPVSASGSRYANSHTGIEVTIPRRWRLIARLSDIIYPTQVLAVASYPLSAPVHPHTCYPASALRQLPSDGVLLRVIDYTRQTVSGKVIRRPDFAPRPTSFRYSDAVRGSFECAGPSYKFDWTADRRAFQAIIWFNPKTVSPNNRAEALSVLNSFRAISASPSALRHSQ
jgi:hypothetical protein